MKKAYFAGGCFWCIASVFDAIDGVTEVVSGFSGGDEADPTYDDVKAQKTGHRETITGVYEGTLVSYAELRSTLLSNTDPFDPDGQFIDRGRSYSLAVYYSDETEKEIAANATAELERASGRSVFVALEPFKSFFAAGEYHQDYHKKHPEEFERELIESGRKKPQ